MTSNACSLRWQAKNPAACKAHHILNYAIKRGRITRPAACERCGVTPARARDGRSLIHGHHHQGYERPLDVQWLCSYCHRKLDPPRKGSLCKRAKLTEEIVVALRVLHAAGWSANALWRTGPMKDRVHMQNILRRTEWQHVP